MWLAGNFQGTLVIRLSQMFKMMELWISTWENINKIQMQRWKLNVFPSVTAKLSATCANRSPKGGDNSKFKHSLFTCSFNSHLTHIKIQIFWKSCDLKKRQHWIFIGVEKILNYIFTKVIFPDDQSFGNTYTYNIHNTELLGSLTFCDLASTFLF